MTDNHTQPNDGVIRWITPVTASERYAQLKREHPTLTDTQLLLAVFEEYQLKNDIDVRNLKLSIDDITRDKTDSED